MGIRHSFELAPAHAHLNLVGWATMALFGVYYHLVPGAAAGRLAKVHFAVATLGVWLLVPGITLSIKSGAEGMAIAGSPVTFASMLIFLATVLRSRA